MLESIRSRAALGAGGAILAVAGVATSFAAAGGTTEPEQPLGVVSAVEADALEPQAFDPLADETSDLTPEPNDGLAEEEPTPGDRSGNPDDEGSGDDEARVLGVPEDSPACDNVGCGEVENAGGVTLHLPQPAVDGINRAAENRAAAQGDDEEEPLDEPIDEEPIDDEPVPDAADEDETVVRGVPEGTPACEIHGCSQVETPGGVTVNVPQPAADGMARAGENRANAGNRGGEDDDDADAAASTSNGEGGRPDWAGPPAGRGPNR